MKINLTTPSFGKHDYSNSQNFVTDSIEEPVILEDENLPNSEQEIQLAEDEFVPSMNSKPVENIPNVPPAYSSGKSNANFLLGAGIIATTAIAGIAIHKNGKASKALKEALNQIKTAENKTKEMENKVKELEAKAKQESEKVAKKRIKNQKILTTVTQVIIQIKRILKT